LTWHNLTTSKRTTAHPVNPSAPLTFRRSRANVNMLNLKKTKFTSINLLSTSILISA